MDIYELSTSEQIDIDDLLDLSNDELFPSASASTDNDPLSLSETPFPDASASSTSTAITSIDFNHDLCIPGDDDVAELEWLSQFVEDSFTDIPSSYSLLNPRNHQYSTSFLSKARSKRSRAVVPKLNWTAKTKREMQREADPAEGGGGGGRRCSHCASEKTPQWRTGPLGPKTLCNACGVRYKSGRLVPEYRPAASPTFVLTQHSNSHRKVLELRRQKGQEEEQVLTQHHRQQRDFEVC